MNQTFNRLSHTWQQKNPHSNSTSTRQRGFSINRWCEQLASPDWGWVDVIRQSLALKHEEMS